MAGDGAVVGLGRPLVDHACWLTDRILAPLAGVALGFASTPAGAQELCRVLFQASVSGVEDGPVEGLDGQVPPLLVGERCAERVADLFRAPPLRQPGSDERAEYCIDTELARLGSRSTGSSRAVRVMR